MYVYKREKGIMVTVVTEWNRMLERDVKRLNACNIISAEVIFKADNCCHSVDHVILNHQKSFSRLNSDLSHCVDLVILSQLRSS